MPTPRAAEGHDKRAVLGELLDAVVLPVGDVDVAVAIGIFPSAKTLESRGNNFVQSIRHEMLWSGPWGCSPLDYNHSNIRLSIGKGEIGGYPHPNQALQLRSW